MPALLRGIATLLLSSKLEDTIFISFKERAPFNKNFDTALEMPAFLGGIATHIQLPLFPGGSTPLKCPLS